MNSTEEYLTIYVCKTLFYFKNHLLIFIKSGTLLRILLKEKKFDQNKCTNDQNI